MNAPDRIIAYNERQTGYTFTAFGPQPHFGPVEYIRADLAATKDARIADLERQLAEAREVKPLEWAREAPYHVARVLNGHYAVQVGDDGVDLRGTFTKGSFTTLEAAKAAAQADYEARILSALKGPTP